MTVGSKQVTEETYQFMPEICKGILPEHQSSLNRIDSRGMLSIHWSLIYYEDERGRGKWAAMAVLHLSGLSAFSGALGASRFLNKKVRFSSEVHPGGAVVGG